MSELDKIINKLLDYNTDINNDERSDIADYLKGLPEKNKVKNALDVLRTHMKDKSEGGLYHGWMCNIKFAVYDELMSENVFKYDHPMSIKTLEACEDGANTFLNRLLS